MVRHAFVVGIRPGKRQEHLALHRAHTDPCQVRVGPGRDPGALWQPIDEIRHLA